MQTIIVDDIQYELNQSAKQASIINSPEAKGNILIPKSISHGNQIYTIISVGPSAFLNNNSIKSISFPDDSEVIEFCEDSFANSSIEAIHIPKELITIKKRWITSSPQLTNIILSPQNKTFKYIDDTFLVSKDVQTIFFVKKNVIYADIPSSVRRIATSAFANCNLLQLITFSHIPMAKLDNNPDPKSERNNSRILAVQPGNNESNSAILHSFHHTTSPKIATSNSVEQIDESAYNSLNDLMPFSFLTIAITAQAALSSFLEEKKHHCNDQKQLDKVFDQILLSNNQNEQPQLEEIDDYAFAGCCMLKRIEQLPISLQRIGDYSFKDDINLQSIEFLGLNIITGKNIFDGCDNLKNLSFANAKRLSFNENTLSGIPPNIELSLTNGVQIRNG